MANKKQYNGITIPEFIRTNLIISAFANEIDYEKVDEFTKIMKVEMLSHSFPPIEGYPMIIDEDDLEGWYIDGSNISEEDLGKVAWKVTNGHHRSIAAINAKIPYFPVELDYSCITNQNDL